MRALFSRSLRVASFWRFWLFSRCTNARAHSNTIQRSWPLDPGSRGRRQEIRTLQRGSWFTTRAFLLLFQASVEYYKSTSSSFHDGSIFMRDQSPPPSPLPPSISKRKRSFRRKKHNISTLFVCISLSFPFLFYRHLVSGTISGQPPPCWGNTCSTLTSTRSLITRRVANALPATFPRESFETLNSSLAYVIKGEAGSVGNRVVFVLFSIFLFGSLYIGQIRQDF